MPDTLTFDTVELNKNFGPYKYPLADRIGPVLQASQNQHPWHHSRSPWGPSVAPPTITALAALRFIQDLFPLPSGARHVKQTVDTAAALRLDRQPIGYGRFIEKTDRGGRRVAVFEVRWREETGLLIGHTRTAIAFPGDIAAKNGPPDGETTSARQKEPKREATLPEITRTVSADALAAFTQDSPVASGLLAADHISELMAGTFGKDWFDNATLSLGFTNPIANGDGITATGRLASRAEEGAVIRKTYDVWAQNQSGEIVASGAGASLVMPPG